MKYKRPLQTNEPVNDRAIPADREVSVIAAIGPLNARKEANSHEHNGHDTNVDDIQIKFSSMTDHQCKASLYDTKVEAKVKPWPTRMIENATHFTAKIGPTGGMRGYTPLTGHPSWGIAWWINDQLIPELVVERGKTYTFTVEGGNDPSNPARYHPFYICDSSEGGYGQKSNAKQARQKVFAGVSFEGEYPEPSAGNTI